MYLTPIRKGIKESIEFFKNQKAFQIVENLSTNIIKIFYKKQPYKSTNF